MTAPAACARPGDGPGARRGARGRHTLTHTLTAATPDTQPNRNEPPIAAAPPRPRPASPHPSAPVRAHAPGFCRNRAPPPCTCLGSGGPAWSSACLHSYDALRSARSARPHTDTHMPETIRSRPQRAAGFAAMRSFLNRASQGGGGRGPLAAALELFAWRPAHRACAVLTGERRPCRRPVCRAPMPRQSPCCPVARAPRRGQPRPLPGWMGRPSKVGRTPVNGCQ
ncbi:MAG: hypothetical protein J3K34DRAFT_19494 [Monoraphidium minutum]|nr:MAG: hypothetical protein J3K34DRAFT_19494 [Monoraphidium minutum]